MPVQSPSQTAVQPLAPTATPAPTVSPATPGSKNPLIIALAVMLAVLLVCSGLGAASWFIFKEQLTDIIKQYIEDTEKSEKNTEDKNGANTDANSDLNISDDEEEEEKEEETGFIRGLLSFPSEFIPDDMEVCAEPIGAGTEICTTEHIAGARGYTYELEVPAGSYYVYAVVPSYNPNYKAYYNEFVACGEWGCDDHTPIEVEVEAGEIVEGIDPGDWYNY